MDAILLQILNGLDKGSAYALIALGLTLIFGTLGVVNFAHGALFMIGAFCAVTLQRLLNLGFVPKDAEATSAGGFSFGGAKETPYVEHWFGEAAGQAIIDWSVPLAIAMSAIAALLLPVAVIIANGGWNRDR